MSRVVVFGSGIDALLAAHAASVLSHDVKIYANRELLDVSGPKILLAPIPMIEAKMASLKVTFKGDPDTMMDKLLNQGGAGREPEGYDIDGRMVWDTNDVYVWLMETYGRFIEIVPDGIGPRVVGEILMATTPDYSVSGIDRDDLCSDRNHSFAAGRIVTMPTADSLGQSITFSGDPDDAWAIEHHLFGESIRSYGNHQHPPVSRSKIGMYLIPQGFSCDCFVSNMAYVGKLGAWDNKWRTHRSFYRTFAALGDAD